MENANLKTPYSLGEIFSCVELSQHLNRPGGDFIKIDGQKHGGLAFVVWRMGDEERSPEMEEIAKSFVRACNRDQVFDELVKAIRKAVDKDLAYLDGEARGITHGDVKALREALAKAEAA